MKITNHPSTPQAIVLRCHVMLGAAKRIANNELARQLSTSLPSDAIIPAAASPEEKIQAILDWMAHGPGRLRSGLAGSAQDRDPTDTLRN
jgi:hypothetical protein